METIPIRIGTRYMPETNGMQRHIAYVERLVATGGPEPSEYAAFNAWLKEVANELATGRMSRTELVTLRQAFGDALSPETLQGFSFSKPHGYSGDYEIIDRIYRKQIASDPRLRNWDRYSHTQSGPRAVRNRKTYFIKLLHQLEAQAIPGENVPVLNVASGPCRDLLEFFRDHRKSGHALTFDCVDSDSEAIEFASALCLPYLDRITFIKANALRFNSPRTYRLIWSAGLFDYLGDKPFTFLLGQLYAMLGEEGELVVGNFSNDNPTRPYMEIVGDWHLHHRSEAELIELATASGVPGRDVRVGKEEEGVNLFLHIKRGAKFIA
jgi:extracellular factor (EF) 3-hydroxypalmitic acid methyl ester biosynthesis protein